MLIYKFKGEWGFYVAAADGAHVRPVLGLD